MQTLKDCLYINPLFDIFSSHPSQFSLLFESGLEDGWSRPLRYVTVHTRPSTMVAVGSWFNWINPISRHMSPLSNKKYILTSTGNSQRKLHPTTTSRPHFVFHTATVETTRRMCINWIDRRQEVAISLNVIAQHRGKTRNKTKKILVGFKGLSRLP